LSLTLISLDGMMVFESIPSVIVQTGVVVVTVPKEHINIKCLI
jgi:hypothetical protein